MGDRTHNGTGGHRLERLEAIFHAARGRDAAGRAAYLARACGDDGALRVAVERLLRADDDSRGALEQPPWTDEAIAARLAGRGDVADPDAQPGVRLGRYRVVERIGDGGFGTVLRAEQETPVRRTVAIKLLKRGLDTDDILQRFRRERQVLAGLEHPNIARLVDGGATDAGRPYLVMEHVDGERIDAWCDAQRLSVRRRLDLFLDVCAAVQYAHAKALVHRDIKPGNILVGADGTVKLLDFGLAKLLEPDDAGTATATADGSRLLTPRYASPEQVRGETATTASDVYALGVLLYELLTGRSPYLGHTGSRHEVERAIVTVDPARPSDAARRDDPVPAADDTAAAIAARRGSTPAQLRRRLRGDLDVILATALAKEPGRRYETVAALAGDVRRHLEARPIVAVREPLPTLVRKFVRRNRALVTAASVIVLAVVGAAVASAVVAVRIADERRVAEAINAFLNDDLLSAAGPTRTANAGLTVREALDRAADRIEGRFDGDPRVEAAIRRTIGDAYRELGLPRQAVEHLRRATGLYRETVGPLDEMTRSTMRSWADALFWDERMDACRDVASELYDLDVRADGRASAAAMATRHLLVQVGDASIDDTRAELREIMEWDAAHLGESDPETLAVMHTLANHYLFEDETEPAEPIIARILAATRAAYGPSHPETLQAMLGQAILYGRTDRIPEAIELLEESVRIQRATRGDDYTDLGITLGHLGIHLEEVGRLDEAEAAYLEGYPIVEGTLGPENGWTWGIARRLVGLYEKRGDAAQAALWRERVFDDAAP